MGGLRQRLAFATAAAWLPLAACQLIAGIGSDELVSPDAGRRSDGTAVHVDGGHDAHQTIKDAARPPRDAREAGKPDTGYDSQPSGTPCQFADVCVPEGTFLGPEGMATAFCGAEAGAVTCGNMTGGPCCSGNPNGHGTSGGFCPGIQAICTGPVCTTCGSSGDPCCVAAGDGGQACGAGLVCAEGTCATCGQAGEPCCLSKSAGSLCNQGMAVCGPDGVCAACNNACPGGGCCDPVHGCVEAGATCTNGLTCMGFSCDRMATMPICGVAGTPCCGGMVCRDGSLCGGNGMCARCGGAGDPCCSTRDGKACAAGHVCDNAGAVCVQCGGPGETCCPGDTCAIGTCNPLANLCDPGLGCGAHCGGVSQTCCTSIFTNAGGGPNTIAGTCAPGMCCDGLVDAGEDAAGVCLLPGAACSNGYVCGDGGCQPCGTMGVTCCADRSCGDAGALTCTDSGLCM